MTDRDLVHRALAGERHAFGMLVERHYAALLRFATRTLNSEAAAQDIVQEALLQAFIHLNELRDPSAFTSWLFGITANLCRGYFRKHPPHTSLEATRPLTTDAPSPERIAEERELFARVRDAIEGLSRRNREAVMLYYVEGLTVREVAALLGISPSAVKGRLHKSRRHIKQRLVLPQERTMIPVTVADVVNHHNEHILILLNAEGTRFVPIWVGPFEAFAIAHFATGHLPHPRPLTYTLMSNMLEGMGGTLKKVEVSALRDDVFYATLTIDTANGPQTFDARPSDSIALALVSGAPISVAPDIMAKLGIQVDSAEVGRGMAQLVRQFKERQAHMERKADTEEYAHDTETVRDLIRRFIGGEIDSVDER